MKKRILAFALALCMLLCTACTPAPQAEDSTEESAVEETVVPQIRPDILKNENNVVENTEMTIKSNDFQVTLHLAKGIALTSIYDATLAHEYITIPNGLFDYTVDGTVYSSLTDMEVLGAKQEGESVYIRAKSTVLDAVFDLIVSPDPVAPAVQIACYVSNDTDKAQYIAMTYPEILPVTTPGAEENSYVSIPQESGWVGRYDEASVMGFSPAAATAPTKNAEDASGGLPTCVNAMEVLSVYNDQGLGGLFIADVNGEIGTDVPPVHMLMNRKVLEGHCVAQMAAGGFCQMGTIAIGAIRDNDWHQAVDYYNQQHSDRTYVEIPTWLRDAGAIYATNNGGVGGNYLLLKETETLYQRMGSFENLPKMLNKAEAMGTNVLLMVDWYEKATISGEDNVEIGKIASVLTPYWNKGDYIPRSDMGGEEAFKAGIQALHDAGGKLIVYVEPFAVLYFSQIGREKGELWAARNPLGELDATYAGEYTYSMSCAVEEWRNYIVEVCVRLVEEYGVDGIYFDSMGNQWNHSYYTNALGKTSTLQEYNAGFIAMCTETREAIQAINPEAVLLCEAGAPLTQYTDGGLTGDFIWGKTVSNPNITASPIRYGLPQANLYVTGQNMSQLKQSFAAGHNLAVCYYWEGDQAYIRQLVQLRQIYKDALIYGQQDYQPKTESDFVAAYSFKGSENTIATLLNLAGETYTGTVTLNAEYANSTWVNELTGQSYTADADGVLNMELLAEELMVLRLAG